MDFTEKFRKQFPFLLDKDFEAFFKITTTQRFKKGEKVINIGETKKKTGILLKGIIRAYITNYQGREVTTLLLEESHVFAAYDPLVLSRPSVQVFECLEPSECLIFDYNDLEKLTIENERIKKVVDKSMMGILLMVIRRNESFIMESPEQRYVKFINKHTELLQRVSQKHLSSYLGITPVSYSRLKKRIHRGAMSDKL